MDKTTMAEFQRIADYVAENDQEAEAKNQERERKADLNYEENSQAEFDIADIADENANSIFDLAEYVAELEARIEALEGGD